MASSSLPRRLSRHLLSSFSSPHRPPPLLSPLRRSFTAASTNDVDPLGPELDAGAGPELVAGAVPDPKSQPQQRLNFERPLENGLDPGVYKAILMGKVGQKPVQKYLKNGKLITLFSLATGGIRNNRRPLEDEDPQEYANRSAVQWHRVVVHPQMLAALAIKRVKPGAIVYLEGNLETKIFSDPFSGLVRRIREIAIRQDGRLVFISEGSNDIDAAGIKGVGYY